MRHGPRAPDGPRHYKLEITLSDLENAELAQHSADWNMTAAATAREAMRLGFALFQLDHPDVARRLALLGGNLPVDWTRPPA